MWTVRRLLFSRFCCVRIPSCLDKYKYTEDMKLTSEIKFVLSYTTADGRAQKVTATKTIQLENYDYLYYHGLTAEDVLKTVTSGYAGNYTLAWGANQLMINR